MSLTFLPSPPKSFPNNFPMPERAGPSNDPRPGNTDDNTLPSPLELKDSLNLLMIRLPSSPPSNPPTDFRTSPPPVNAAINVGPSWSFSTSPNPARNLLPAARPGPSRSGTGARASTHGKD